MARPAQNKRRILYYLYVNFIGANDFGGFEDHSSVLEPDLLVHGESPVAFLALLLEISALDVNGVGEAHVMATLFRAVGKVGNAELRRLDVLQFESLKQEETILTFTTTFLSDSAAINKTRIDAICETT